MSAKDMRSLVVKPVTLFAASQVDPKLFKQGNVWKIAVAQLLEQVVGYPEWRQEWLAKADMPLAGAVAAGFVLNTLIDGIAIELLDTLPVSGGKGDLMSNMLDAALANAVDSGVALVADRSGSGGAASAAARAASASSVA